MVAGTWVNLDGLVQQFGQQKTIPELGGDYLLYGETREVEQIIALVPYQLGLGGTPVPGAPTSFSGATTPIAAGIQSMTQMFPLQVTAPVITTTSGTLLLQAPQLFIEEVTVETLVAAAGGTSINVGLVTSQGASTGSAGTFVQIAPNAGTQILNTFPIASMNTVGMRATFNQQGSTAGFLWGAAAPTTTTGAGSWLGNVPLVTTTLPNSNFAGGLAQEAWFSTIATGTFTNGLIKLRVRYTMYGNINY